MAESTAPAADEMDTTLLNHRREVAPFTRQRRGEITPQIIDQIKALIGVNRIGTAAAQGKEG